MDRWERGHAMRSCPGEMGTCAWPAGSGYVPAPRFASTVSSRVDQDDHACASPEDDPRGRRRAVATISSGGACGDRQARKSSGRHWLLHTSHGDTSSPLTDDRHRNTSRTRSSNDLSAAQHLSLRSAEPRSNTPGPEHAMERAGADTVAISGARASCSSSDSLLLAGMTGATR